MNAGTAADPSLSKDSFVGKYCIYSLEDDKSFPMPYFPLIMFPKGVTMRVLLRTDGWNCVPKKAVSTADGTKYAADSVLAAITDTRFKFKNSRIMTSEILLSSELQK